MKALLDEGAIGTVLRGPHDAVRAAAARALPPSPTLPWRLDPAIAGAGLFLDLGSHTLDLLDHLLGPIVEVRGAAANQGGLYAAEDTIAAQLSFDSGVVGAASWSFVTGVKLDRTEILGTAGKLQYACFDDAPIVLETAAGRQEIRVATPPHVQQPLIQTIVDQLRGRGRAPATAATAARHRGDGRDPGVVPRRR